MLVSCYEQPIKRGSVRLGSNNNGGIYCLLGVLRMRLPKDSEALRMAIFWILCAGILLVVVFAPDAFWLSFEPLVELFL
jgi:hypothetical protein